MHGNNLFRPGLEGNAPMTSAMEALPQFHVWAQTESLVERRHSDALLADGSLKPLWRAGDIAALILFRTCAQEKPDAVCGHTQDQHAVMFLGSRALTSTLAALRLLMRGYYLQALTIERDVLETALLIQLFSERPDQITVWRDCDAKTRWKSFRPGVVAKKLKDARIRNRYDDEYSDYSELGGHPTPTSAVVTWRKDLMRGGVGPFFLEQTARKVLVRIMVNACDACYHILAALNLRDAFAESWREVERSIDEWNATVD